MDPRLGYPKLLFVIDNLSTGGAQRQLINLAIGLKQRGYSVNIFCYAPGDLLAQPIFESGIQVHRCLKRSRFSSDVIQALRNVLNTSQYDLILSFLTTPSFYSIFAGQLTKLHRIPVVVSERFCDLPGRISLLEQFIRQSYRFSQHVVVNSHHQRINFAEKYPWLKSRLSTIYNGYDLSVFSPADLEPNNESLNILSIGSVSPYKNGLSLIEALKILKNRDCGKPRVTWIGQRVMAGERLKYLREMEQKIHEYELVDQWQWLDQRNDIVQQLHHHDVLVHPSYAEGLPNVVCEALACGRPVIVSETLDHPMLVQDGESGYLFDWQNPNDLATKIKTFSELTLEKRKEMGRKGRQFAENNLSLGRYADEYERLFLHILNS